MPAPRKATPEVVRHIRESYRYGEVGLHRLAKQHELSKGCVQKIIYGITWKKEQQPTHRR